jgi:hypothetical protein
MDHTAFADLQKKMRQEIDVLKNQPFQTDQEHMLYWNVKDEVDGISVSCDGHIEINENIKQKKNLLFKQLRLQSPVLSESLHASKSAIAAA